MAERGTLNKLLTILHNAHTCALTRVLYAQLSHVGQFVFSSIHQAEVVNVDVILISQLKTNEARKQTFRAIRAFIYGQTGSEYVGRAPDLNQALMFHQ